MDERVRETRGGDARVFCGRMRAVEQFWGRKRFVVVVVVVVVVVRWVGRTDVFFGRQRHVVVVVVFRWCG